jgi:hypothetical protein
MKTMCQLEASSPSQGCSSNPHAQQCPETCCRGSAAATWAVQHSCTIPFRKRFQSNQLTPLEPLVRIIASSHEQQPSLSQCWRCSGSAYAHAALCCYRRLRRGFKLQDGCRIQEDGTCSYCSWNTHQQQQPQQQLTTRHVSGSTSAE